jgi:hypothetical protein
MAERRESGSTSAGAKRESGSTSAAAKRESESASGAGRQSRSRDADGGAPQSAEDQVRALYEQAESSSAQAFEEFVSKPSFGWLLARSAENVAAMSRIGADFADIVLRTVRIAGRADIVRLARQLQRNEDKLERVLQEVEQLRDEVGDGEQPRRSNGGDPKADERAKAQS